MTQIVTPAQIEARLYALSKEIDEAHEELAKAESDYNQAKSTYEISMAKSRMTYASKSSPTGKNYTVQERDDLALIDNEQLHMHIGITEASVKAARANASRIKTQVEIARSIGTSVRTSMDLT
jgi:4-hydroxy-3-methylbut-2-en-1-yl diphosphate synthase IspG/GcpE